MTTDSVELVKDVPSTRRRHDRHGADEGTALDGAPDKVMEIDAFHAYWEKKLLGEEMTRVIVSRKLYPAYPPAMLSPAPEGPGRHPAEQNASPARCSRRKNPGAR